MRRPGGRRACHVELAADMNDDFTGLLSCPFANCQLSS